MDRRDLLKMFGVGSIIAPIVGGSVVEAAASTLLEPPKVALAQSIPTTPNTKYFSGSTGGPVEVTLTARSNVDGSVITIKALAGSVTYNVNKRMIKDLYGNTKAFVRDNPTMTFTFTCETPLQDGALALLTHYPG